MSLDHEAMIQRSYRAFRENDAATLLEIYHPEAVWDMSGWGGWPEDPIYRGHEGVLGVLKMVWDVVDEWDVHPVEILPLDDERRFVRAGLVLRGSLSGIEFESPGFAQIISFRDGLIARIDQYQDVSEARRVAGLEPG